MSSSMNVSGPANQPHYDVVIANAKEAVMNLGDKQVSVKKGIRAGFSNISAVFSKQSAKNESKAPASATDNTQELTEILKQAKAAKTAIKSEIDIALKGPNRSTLITKLAELNTYISTLEKHVSKSAQEQATLSQSHKVVKDNTSLTDRISATFSKLKGVPGEPSIADKVKTRAEAIKSALTPKKADQATQESYEKKSESFSQALQNAYKLRDTVAGGESDALAKAIEAAEKYQSSQLRSPIKADTATAKTLAKASEQLTSLTDTLTTEIKAVFTPQAERTIDMVLSRLTRNNPNKQMNTPAMKQDLLRLADKYGVSSENQNPFLENLGKVKDAETLRSFLKTYNVNI